MTKIEMINILQGESKITITKTKKKYKDNFEKNDNFTRTKIYKKVYYKD